MIKMLLKKIENYIKLLIKNWWFEILAIAISAIFFLVGSISGESFDDAALAQHGQFFYDMNIDPLIYSIQGAYYTWILIGGYSLTIILQAIGFSNIITMQIGVKFPFILFGIFTSFFIYEIAKNLGIPRTKAKLVSLLFLTEPVLYYVAGIHGIPLVISMFFLIASLGFLQKGKYKTGAILYGVSCATYLYPIFGIPFLFRYFQKNKGIKSSVLLNFLILAFFLIGTVPSLLLYKLSGISFSNGSTVTVVSSFFTPINLPLYSLFDILYFLPFSGLRYSIFLNVLFLVSLGVSSILLAIIPRATFFKFDNLILFLTLQGLLFILFNPANAPQYLYAISPLLLLCSLIFKKDHLLVMLTFATLLDFLTLITWNPTALLGLFFADTYPKLLSYSQTFPFKLVFFLSFLYGIIILTMSIDVMLRIFKNMKSDSMDNKKYYDDSDLDTKFYINSETRIKYNFVAILSTTVIVLFLIMPGLSNLPANYLQMNQINEQKTQPIVSSLNGTESFTFQPPYLSIVDHKYYKDYNGSISIKSYNPNIYEWFVTNDSFSVNKDSIISESLIFPFEVSNVSILLASKGNLSGSLFLTIAGKDHLLKNITISSSVYNHTYNTEYIYYNISGIFNPGNYTIFLSSPSNSSSFILGSCHNEEGYTIKFTKYVSNLSINGRVQNGDSLALLVSAYPVFKIGSVVLISTEINNNLILPISNTLITSSIHMTINGTFDYGMELTVYLPSSRYIDNWNENPVDVILGIFMLITTLGFLIYLLKKVR
jgi:hypothetical protein